MTEYSTNISPTYSIPTKQPPQATQKRPAEADAHQPRRHRENGTRRGGQPLHAGQNMRGARMRAFRRSRYRQKGQARQTQEESRRIITST